MDEALNGSTGRVVESKVPPEPKKELRPEEKVEVERLRAKFKKFHDLLSDNDLLEAETFLGILEGALTSSFQMKEKEIKVQDLKVTVENDQMIKALNLMNDLSVQEAVTFTRTLYNKMKGYTMERTKDWKLKDLEIELL